VGGGYGRAHASAAEGDRAAVGGAPGVAGTAGGGGWCHGNMAHY